MTRTIARKRSTRARLKCKGERVTARLFGVTVYDVRSAVQKYAPRADHDARSEELRLDLGRVGVLTERFFEMGATHPDPMVACAGSSIWIRLGERKAALLGLDRAPYRDLAPPPDVPVHKPGTTTTVIECCLNRLAGVVTIEGTAEPEITAAEIPSAPVAEKGDEHQALI